MIFGMAKGKKKRTGNELDESSVQDNGILDMVKVIIREELKEIRDMFHAMKTENEQLKQELIERRDKVDCLSVENKHLREKVNDLEAYTRRNSIRIYGVHDDTHETLDDCLHKIISLFRTQLGLDFDQKCFDAFHRVGRRNNYTRAIIVKFVRRTDRDATLKARRHLKGTGVTIVEDLTSKNHQLLTKARSHPSIMETWSSNGRIFAKSLDGKKFQLNTTSTLDEQLTHQRLSQSYGNSFSSRTQNTPAEHTKTSSTKMTSNTTKSSNNVKSQSSQRHINYSSKRKSIFVTSTSTPIDTSRQDSDPSFIDYSQTGLKSACSTHHQDNNDGVIPKKTTGRQQVKQKMRSRGSPYHTYCTRTRPIASDESLNRSQ